MSAAVALRRLETCDSFEEAQKLFNQFPEFLRTQEALEMNHSDMERELAKRGRELTRTLYQGWLDELSPGEADGPVIDAEGKERTRQRTQARGLATVFGSVTVKRTGHGAEGEPSLHPLDGHLNLPEERYSLELCRRAAEEASKNSFDEAVETLAKYTGTRIPKRQVEEIVVRAAQDFDAFYESRRQEPQAPRAEQGSVLVITTDGKGVVMHKDDLRPATRKAAERRRNKMVTRLSKGEKRNRKRMATVAAVYTVAPYVRTPEQVYLALARAEDGDGAEDLPRRPRPEHKRVWASLVQEPAEVIEEAFREALDRDPDHEKSWVSVVDGNKHQLRILKDLAKKYYVQLTIIVDIMHVLDYLWKAGHALAVKSGSELEPWVLERLGWILEGRVSQVAAGMRRSATLRGLGKKQRAPVDACADYLLKYKNYLAYDQYLAAGFPIGSGVIEGACRHLVKDRLDLTGARWRLIGAEAILHLRALRSSHDFDEYWLFHEAREYDRNHRARYADGVVPPLKSSRSNSPNLRCLP